MTPERRRARADEVETLEQRLDALVTPTYRLALLATGDPAAADEVVADAVSRVWERARRGGIDDLGAYLRTAVLNEVRSRGRRRSALHRALVRLRPSAARTQPDVAQRRADRDALVTALSQLPERHRVAVVLRHYEGYDVAATAAAMDAPEGSVTSWTKRGLDHLRTLLDGSDDT